MFSFSRIIFRGDLVASRSRPRRAASDFGVSLARQGAGYRTFCPKLRKRISHARVKRAVDRPLLGRYLCGEVDYPRQSFADVRAAQGVESIVSQFGIPAVIPADKVEIC